MDHMCKTVRLVNMDMNSDNNFYPNLFFMGT